MISDFADENTTIGDNCRRYFFLLKSILISQCRFLSDSHILIISSYMSHLYKTKEMAFDHTDRLRPA